MAEMGDLLGFQKARRVDRSPWAEAGGREDIKASRAGEALVQEVRLLEQAHRAGRGVKRREEFGIGILGTVHDKLKAQKLFTRGPWHSRRR